MFHIETDQYHEIEKRLLGFGLRYTVALVFLSVANIPIETGKSRKINHACILQSYTDIFKYAINASLTRVAIFPKA